VHIFHGCLRADIMFCTTYLQVDQRILKAISIEHSKDVDSAVVTVLDEVMPSMTDLVGAFSAHREAMPCKADSAGNLFANSAREVGSSSSAGECEDSSFSQFVLSVKGMSIHGLFGFAYSVFVP
jgi:hypothetical protein